MENRKPLQGYLLLILGLLIITAVVIGVIVAKMPQKAQETTEDFLNSEIDDSTSTMLDSTILPTEETVVVEPTEVEEPAVETSVPTPTRSATPTPVKTYTPPTAAAPQTTLQGNLELYDVDPVDPSNAQSSRIGATLRAKWKVETASTVVKLSYSFDNGASWQTLSENELKDSFYLWQIPETTATSVIFKIYSGNASIVSNAVSIQQTNE